MKLNTVTFTIFLFFVYNFCLANTKSISDTNYHIKIVEKPIKYDNERKKLSLEYLKNRHGLIQSTPNINPTMIVLHYTGKGTANSIYQYFNQNKIEKGRKLNGDQSELNVSSHYVIDRDGTIYRLVPDTMFCRHIIGLNYCAIGVENIGSKDQPLNDKQVEANVRLIRYLTKKYGIKYVIGHSEYINFRNTHLWKEKNAKYITHKEDPGNIFLEKVRYQIKDLSLKYKP